MIEANNPALKSWVPVRPDSDFPIQNIPFGIAKNKTTGQIQLVTRIGDDVMGLYELARLGYLNDVEMEPSVFDGKVLNPMISKGKAAVRSLRNRLSELLRVENTSLQHNERHRRAVFFDKDEMEMLLPVQIGDYTDFYSSEYHAYHVGCMFRDPDRALLPNWKHLPVAYHGRASSIVVSGKALHRPKGQQKKEGEKGPVFGPSKSLDFELEMAFIIGKATALGDSVSTEDAEDHIFGLCLFNDWSARDIQQWEYVPLGPFLSKNFASSISPWIVTLDALEPFRTANNKQEPDVLPYLRFTGKKYYDIELEVYLKPASGDAIKVSASNFKYMYWNMCQQLAHHTVGGCNINVGDVMASGTISGPEDGQYGSMLEITWKGSKPLLMPDGTKRTFLADHDEVIVRGWGHRDGVRIGFGELRTEILPAK